MGKTQWHNLLVLKSEGIIRKKPVIFTLAPKLIIKIMKKIKKFVNNDKDIK